jgi:hypothetical protein
MVEFGRLDYLTRAGWVVGHAGIALQDPQRYVTGLGRRATVARFVPLDGDYRPGQPVLPPVVPEFSLAPRGKVPGTKISECAACGGPHDRPWECVL